MVWTNKMVYIHACAQRERERLNSIAKRFHILKYV